MTIRLFVGTDPAQHAAERALEASVRANTPDRVDITWMRGGDPGWDWGGLDAGWATPFSLFRWVIPDVCGYQGRAIYMDVDMLALADLRELWEWPIPDGQTGAYAGKNRFKADVIVWDCAAVEQWPDARDRDRRDLTRRLQGPRLPDSWDHRDELHEGTKILHYTCLRTQPWKPYPDRYDYTPHKDPAACALWEHYAAMIS